jgi:outer membrane cobalamin receptor
VAAFRQRVGNEGMVKFYGNFTQTDFSLYNHDIDNDDIKTLYDLKNRYRYLNGFYKTPLNQNWSVRGGVSYTFLQNDAVTGDADVDETESGVHVKSVLEGSLTDHIEIKTGVELIRRDYEQQYSSEGFSAERNFTEDIIGTFVETDVYFSNKLVARGGARFEYNSLNGLSSIDPRVSLAYKTGDVSQVSLAAGQFRQSAKNQFTKLDHTLNPEKAQHYILNYQRIDDDKTFRVEAYYKRYSDLIKFANEDGTELTNSGTGYAKGVELFWRDKKSVRRLDYWVSYSFLDTERDYLNFPGSATPYFASQHNFSIVGKYFFEKLKSQVGTTWSYTSGRPYNNPNEDKFNGSKTPYYSDLSLNWSYLPHPQVIVFISATNLLGRDNIFGYEYSTQESDEGLYNRRAIRQAAPRFLFLGIFITFSKNKTMNQLPSL